MSYQAGLVINGNNQMITYNTKQSNAIRSDAGETSFIGAVSESISAQLGAAAVAGRGTIKEVNINQNEMQVEMAVWADEEDEALQFINKIERILGRSRA
jgi:hypothetical protein